MSWSQAQSIAQRMYTELRAQHSPGFIRMILRALERLLNAEERKPDADKTQSPERPPR